METSEVVGGIIAFVLVIIIFLWVTSNYPDFIDEVKDLFEDVFGFTRKEMLKGVEEKNKDVSLKIFKGIKDAYMNCKKSEKENCVCDFKAYNMPANYKIILDGNTIELRDNKERILEQESFEADICIMNSMDSYDDKMNEIIISYDGGLEVNGYEFGENYPKLYNTKDGKVCFIGYERNNVEEFISSLRCDSGERYGDEEMKALFNSLIFKFKDCFRSKEDIPLALCKCSDVDFRNKLYPGYSIVAHSDDKGVIFLLMLGSQVLASNSYDPDSGEINLRGKEKIKSTGFLDKIKLEILNAIDNIRYFYDFLEDPDIKFVDSFDYKNLNDFNGFLVRIKSHLETGKHYDGVFFSESLPSLPVCYSWVDVYEEGCGRNLDFWFKFDRIKNPEHNYLEAVNALDKSDKYSERELLLLGIMATETEIEPEAISIEGCAGLMQFCYDTAIGSPVFKGEAKNKKVDIKDVIKVCCKKEGKEEHYCEEESEGKKEYLCEREGFLKDLRFYPELSIKAAYELIEEKTNHFKGYSNSEVLGVAAYNVGQGKIDKAIKSKDLDTNVGWKKVKEGLKDEVSASKYDEIRCYPYYVRGYYDYFKGKLVGEDEEIGEKVKMEDIETELSKKEETKKEKVDCKKFSEDECYGHLKDNCIPVKVNQLGTKGDCWPCSSIFERRKCVDIRSERLCETPSFCGRTLNCEWFKGECIDRGEIDCTKITDEDECYERLEDDCIPIKTKLLDIEKEKINCLPCYPYSATRNVCEDIRSERLCETPSFCGESFKCRWNEKKKEKPCQTKEDYCDEFSGNEESCIKNGCLPVYGRKYYIFGEEVRLSGCDVCPSEELYCDGRGSKSLCELKSVCGSELSCEWGYIPGEIGVIGVCNTLEERSIVKERSIEKDSIPKEIDKKIESVSLINELLKSAAMSGGAQRDANKREVWANAIFNTMDKTGMGMTSENAALVLTIIEQESSFNPDPDVNLSKLCKNLPTRSKLGISRTGTEQCDHFFGRHTGLLNGNEFAKRLIEGKQGSISDPDMNWIQRQFWEWVEPDLLSTVEINIGPMQIKGFRIRDIIAKETGAKYEDVEIDEETFQKAFTIEGGVEYGIKYLKEIYDVYVQEDDGLNKDNVRWILADYNGGTYSSRNAELQYELYKFVYGKEPSSEFIDGDFLIWEALYKPSNEKSNTEILVEKFAKKYNLNLGNIREQLELEKTDEFVNTLVYRAIKSKYEEKYGSALFGRVPTAKTRSLKHGIGWSAEKYENKAINKFYKFCKRETECVVA